jgi:hypothetical protein
MIPPPSLPWFSRCDLPAFSFFYASEQQMVRNLRAIRNGQRRCHSRQKIDFLHLCPKG